MKRLTIIVLVFAGFLLAACNGDQPQISLESTNLDLGDVVNGEIIERDLMVRNAGSGTLVVESVSTSCGCTSATLEPMTISPAGDAILHIEFDSGAHGPDENGQLTRQIFISSNDPQQPDMIVELAANVLPAE